MWHTCCIYWRISASLRCYFCLHYLQVVCSFRGPTGVFRTLPHSDPTTTKRARDNHSTLRRERVQSLCESTCRVRSRRKTYEKIKIPKDNTVYTLSKRVTAYSRSAYSVNTDYAKVPIFPDFGDNFSRFPILAT